jgi:hypothetical protein|nr:MAG TPA: hypothetical protein [Bacteriophage sp.]
MTDIYVKPVIIDVETGDIIDNDSFDTKMLLSLYKLGYDFQANQVNEHIDSWNEEFERLYPDIYNDLHDPVKQEFYDNFIVERWQKIIDDFNNIASTIVKDAKLFIDDLCVKMNDGKGHIIELRTVNPN